MTLAHHATDHPVICSQHDEFTNRIGDAVMKIQDEAYKLGRQRGRTEANAELLEALKSTGLFLHHCWCDVQMNDYSFEKLNQQMAIVDAAIAKAEGQQ